MGHQKSLRLRVCTTDEFPVLLVLSKENGSVDIVDVVKGSCDLQSILGRLMTTLDTCHDQLRLEAAEEVRVFQTVFSSFLNFPFSVYQCKTLSAKFYAKS